jgi:arylsulfatase A-like enzyme
VNILFILEDALRRDRLGCYGYSRPTSPNLDRMAAEGVVFHETVAVSAHTLPPIVSLLSGWWTFTHGLVGAGDYPAWRSGERWRGMTLPLHTLARAGYLVDGEMVMRWAPLGFERDTEDPCTFFEANRNRPWFFFASPYSTHLPYNPPRAYYEMFLDPGYRQDEASRSRVDVVRREMIIHPPGLRSLHESGAADHIGQGEGAHRRSAASVAFQPEDRPAVSALYDGEVRVFDDLLGVWLRKLEELGLLDDTLVLVTADHGEELLDRGHVGHSSCNLMGTLFDEILMVPLILRYPRRLPAGRVVREQVSQADVMPTLFDLLGLETPYTPDGASLLPLLSGAGGAFRREAYAQTPVAGWQALPGDRRQIHCVRRREWKLIVRLDGEGGATRELYDLRRDPGETRNVIAETPEEALELAGALERLASTPQAAAR